MREQLEALARLAAMDEAARGYDEELTTLPAKIESMRGDVGALETLLAAERRQVEDARSLKQQREEDLRSRTEALSRAKAKMAKARNLKEGDMAEREVDANRRLIKEREEEIAKIGAAIDQKATSLEEREAQFEEARQMLAEEEQTATARLGEVRGLREKVLVGRGELLAMLPRQIVSRYERVKQAKGSAVVVVEDATCLGCRIELAPQRWIEVLRGEDFYQCPHCHRMVIYKGLLEPSAPAETPS